MNNQTASDNIPAARKTCRQIRWLIEHLSCCKRFAFSKSHMPYASYFEKMSFFKAAEQQPTAARDVSCGHGLKKTMKPGTSERYWSVLSAASGHVYTQTIAKASVVVSAGGGTRRVFLAFAGQISVIILGIKHKSGQPGYTLLSSFGVRRNFAANAESEQDSGIGVIFG